jgi:hypothetical protein
MEGSLCPVKPMLANLPAFFASSMASIAPPDAKIRSDLPCARFREIASGRHVGLQSL